MTDYHRLLKYKVRELKKQFNPPKKINIQ